MRVAGLVFADAASPDPPEAFYLRSRSSPGEDDSSDDDDDSDDGDSSDDDDSCDDELSVSSSVSSASSAVRHKKSDSSSANVKKLEQLAKSVIDGYQGNHVRHRNVNPPCDDHICSSEPLFLCRTL